MNQSIVEYLEQNKEKYTQESLTKQLQNAGHDPQEIQACIAFVYGTQSAPVGMDTPQKKMGKLARSFALVKQSFSVLKKDKEIMMFPIISSIVSAIVMITFIVPVFIFFEVISQNNITIYASIFVFYVVSYFIVIFFNSGLITCAHMRLSGQDPTFKDGMKNAFDHLGSILMWTLISATVGLILQIILDQLERLGVVGQMIGRAIIGLIGFAWGLVTYFVVPFIIIDDTKPMQAIKDSAELFKRTWGENLIGNFSMGLFFGLLGFVGVLPFIASIFSGSLKVVLIVAGALVIYWVFLGIVSASLKGIFIAALYIYAKTGSVPEGFDSNLVIGAFKKKEEKKSFLG